MCKQENQCVNIKSIQFLLVWKKNNSYHVWKEEERILLW